MLRSLFTGWLLALCLCTAAGAAEKPAPPAIGLRIVELPGSLDRDDLVEHLDFLHGAGFNALWVQAHQIAANPLDHPDELDAAAYVLADWCKRRKVRLVVSINPVAAGAHRFALVDGELVQAVRAFARRVRRNLGASDLVLSFQGAGNRLAELRDVVRYGTDAPAAHADLARRLASSRLRGQRLWVLPWRASSDPSLNVLRDLPSRVGLVWHGPAAISPEVTASHLDRLESRVGARPILLRDRFPANQSGNRMPLSHNLGPLRGRDAALAGRLAGHASVAMEAWAASRLTLLTVADWGRSPHAYEAKPGWERAMKRLAGEDVEALEALRTQALEWGGPPGGRNHHTALEDNPTAASSVLRDPALASRWRWTLARYPERMKQLDGLADRAFRDELLSVMARRLSIARAIPPVREILARQAAGRSDLGSLVSELNRLRSRPGRPGEQLALERFLIAGGILELLDSAEDAPKRND